MTAFARETPRHTDVVVVGGGVTGAAAAWALARLGVGVVLLERFGAGHRGGAAHGLHVRPPDRALLAGAGPLWEELGVEAGGAGTADADAAVGALQAAAEACGAVVRHHRRVTAVEPADGGVVVRSAAGASVRARAAVVAVGGWPADVLGVRPGSLAGPLPPPGDPAEVVLDRIGPVLVAAGSGGYGVAAAPAVGRVLADLALGAPAGARVVPLSAAAAAR